LFPDCNLAAASPNNKNRAFDTGKFTYCYDIDKYNIPYIFLPFLGTSYTTVRIHSLITLKELEDMAPTLYEWFPENGSMGEYLGRQQILRDILITTLENRAKTALAPLGVDTRVYLSYFIPDACKNNVNVGILFDSDKLIQIQTSEENFDVFLQDAPQIIEHFKELVKKGWCSGSGKFNNYPYCADLKNHSLKNVGWFRERVTSPHLEL